MLPRWQRQLEVTFHRSAKRQRNSVTSLRLGLQRRWFATPTDIAQEQATKDHNDPREKVVILGSGWAGVYIDIPIM